LVEVIITSALLSVAILGIVKVFTASRRAYAVHEVAQTLKKAGLEAIARLQRELVSSKRLFGDVPGDRTYLNALQLPATLLTEARLPAVVEGASLETPAPDAAGNTLLFTVTLKPLDVAGVRVSVYRFHCYFLSADTVNLGGQPRLELWAWQSVPYADRQFLSQLSTAVLPNVLTELAAQHISDAWDVSAATATTAFSTISGSTLVSATALIRQARADRCTKLLTGLTGDNFRLGVCPNVTAGMTTTPPLQVPRFIAVPSALFPSGFEIIAGGDSQTRQVFVRLVMAAQGTFKGLAAYEQTALVTLRDVW
jgi:hypothetical protein